MPDTIGLHVAVVCDLESPRAQARRLQLGGLRRCRAILGDRKRAGPDGFLPPWAVRLW